MVSIPPVKIVMTGGWFMALFYHVLPILMVKSLLATSMCYIHCFIHSLPPLRIRVNKDLFNLFLLYIYYSITCWLNQPVLGLAVRWNQGRVCADEDVLRRALPCLASVEAQHVNQKHWTMRSRVLPYTHNHWLMWWFVWTQKVRHPKSKGLSWFPKNRIAIILWYATCSDKLRQKFQFWVCFPDVRWSTTYVQDGFEKPRCRPS